MPNPAVPNWGSLSSSPPPGSAAPAAQAQPATPPQSPDAPPKWGDLHAAPPAAAPTWDSLKPAPPGAPASTDNLPAARMPAGLLPSVQSAVDQESARRGIPVWQLRAIARLESGGMAHPETAASPAGAQGAMQLMPDTFKSISKGNINNLADNVQAGAAYYQTMLRKYGDPVKAAGAYNMGPGAFDEYLAGKRALPAETAQYMANMAAMHAPIDRGALTSVPAIAAQLPPSAVHGPVQTAYIPLQLPTKRLPTQGHSNLDPKKAAYEWYDQMFGVMDAGFIASNAGMADISMGSAGKYMHDAFNLWMTNPAAASAEYGPNARSMLLLQSEIGDDKIAKYPQLGMIRENARLMLASPKLAAGQTAIEEFFNPLAAGAGELTGRVLGMTGALLNQSVAGRYITHLASPFKGIVAAHGENARNALAQVGNAMKHADIPATAARSEFFDGLTQSEQWEVVRRSQGLAPNAAHAAKDAAIQSRALALRADIVKRSAAKLAAKTLTQDQIKDVRTFFPMKGAHANPDWNEDTMAFVDQLRPGVSNAGPSAESTHFAKFSTVDEAEANGTFHPNEVSAATQYFKHVRAGEQNIAWENGMRDLAQAHPEMIRFGASTPGGGFAKAPLDKYGNQMVNLVQMGIHTSSPTLQDAWISKPFAAFLATGKNGGQAAATLSGVSTNELLSVENWIQKANKAQRAAIFSGPSGLIYHQFNNLAPNAAAAVKAGLDGTVRNYARALVGAAFSVGDIAKMIPGPIGEGAAKTLEAAEAHFFVGSNEYATGLAKAIAAGADAHFGEGLHSALGGDMQRLLSLDKSELTPMEKFDRFLSEGAQWQTHAVFGKRGEGQFVATLFKHFTEKMGMAPEDAAWQTRAALGPYQDLNPDSWPSKLMLFYPWLKGNGAHWVLNFLTNPKIPRAQIEAFHRYNEEAGDPRTADALHRRNPSQLYSKDAEGRDVSNAVPFPWRLAEEMGNVVTPSFMNHKDFNERFGDAAGIVTSRLRVLPGVVGEQLATLVNQKANPRGQFSGIFESAYDKNQPGWEQVREATISAIEKSGLYPAPMLVKDIADNGFSQQRLGDYVSSLVGSGTITRGQSAEVKKTFKRFATRENMQMGKLYKRMQSANPYTQEEFDGRRARILKLYEDSVKRKTDQLNAQLVKKTAAPSWNTLSATPPKWDSLSAKPPGSTK